MTRRRPAVCLLSCLIALLALAGCTGSHRSTPVGSGSPLGGGNDGGGGGRYDGIELSPPQPRPAFTLTDTRGARFDFSTVTSDHPTLLYFGFTDCTDACPETMANVALALKAVSADLRNETYVVFVTTDVVHDSGAKISQWLGNFEPMATGGHYVGLRGTQAQVETAEASARIPFASDDGQLHSTELLLFAPDNYAHVVYDLTSPVTQQQDQIAHDLPLIAKL